MIKVANWVTPRIPAKIANTSYIHHSAHKINALGSA